MKSPQRVQFNVTVSQTHAVNIPATQVLRKAAEIVEAVADLRDGGIDLHPEFQVPWVYKWEEYQHGSSQRNWLRRADEVEITSADVSKFLLLLSSTITKEST